MSLPKLSHWILYPIFFVLGLAAVGIATVAIVVAMIYPRLPSLDILTDYRPRIPLRVYTADNHLIGEFGEERRAIVRFQDVPDMMKLAILAAEDDRFYQHGGVDAQSVVRAFLSNMFKIGRRQGGSTITQQVAKNFYLTNERTYSRKLYEALLSFKIESNLTKDQIFELYINQIFLGQKAYGFAAAAQIYFGKSLKDLNIAEVAMLAGLPQSPSKNNPVNNPKQASRRQQVVLKRMLDLGYITPEQRDEALQQVLIVKRELSTYPVHAEFVAEMARQIAADSFPDEVYTRGLNVYTTILKEDQAAAYASLRKNVFDYDRKHGYRGAEGFVDISNVKPDEEEKLDELLQDFSDTEDLRPAIVLKAEAKELQAYVAGGETISLKGEGLKLASKMLDDKAPPTKRLRAGSVIRVQVDEKGNWRIAQMPEVESALVAADPQTGAVRALVGGFDFNHNKFNHVTQAWRQPGSSFKPFIYSAALEKGFTPASIIEDEPITIPASVTGSRDWTPKNYDGRFEGPMRMRTALAKSKNMVSIRLLQDSGVEFVQDYVTKFGFDADKHPPVLTMALGAGSVTPWQMVAAYSVFANGGYRVQPYIVKEIRDNRGQLLAQTHPVKAGDESIRTIDARNAFLMDSMMRDVTTYGTAGRASALLKRRDLAGKTGTTNEHVDAWFCGYQQTIAGCVWVGFDQPQNMGRGETGGITALPAWINFMATALKDVPQSFMKQPTGLVSVDTADSLKGPSKELFYKENIPEVIQPEPHNENDSAPID